MSRKAKPKRETLEMVDGRVFFSDDNWQTIFMMRPSGKRRQILDKQEADHIRFLAVVVQK